MKATKLLVQTPKGQAKNVYSQSTTVVGIGPRPMLQSQLSRTQLDALRCAARTVLKKRDDGLWYADGANTGFPTGTVKALEERGLLRRRHVSPIAWKDEWQITPAGFALVSRGGHVRKVRVLLCRKEPCQGSDLGCPAKHCGHGRRWRTWTHAHHLIVFGRCPSECAIPKR